MIRMMCCDCTDAKNIWDFIDKFTVIWLSLTHSFTHWCACAFLISFTPNFVKLCVLYLSNEWAEFILTRAIKCINITTAIDGRAYQVSFFSKVYCMPIHAGISDSNYGNRYRAPVWKNERWIGRYNGSTYTIHIRRRVYRALISSNMR